MNNKITAIRIKKSDGQTYSDLIPISIKSENIIYDNTYNLNDILGNIEQNTNIQGQLNRLNMKVNAKVAELNEQMKQTLLTYILNNYPFAEEEEF